MLRALVVIQGVVPSTEISIILPFKCLAARQLLEWSMAMEDDVTEKDVKDVDIVVFHRNGRPNVIRVLELAQRWERPIIYDIDDNFLDLSETTPVGRYYALPQVRRTIERLLRESDIVKAGSATLERRILSYASRTVVHPYAVDPGHFATLRQRPEESSLIIGWGGTRNHDRDLDFVADAIHSIKTTPGTDLVFEFIGCVPERLADCSSVKVYPFMDDYWTYMRFLWQRRWDIGIAPLLDTPGNQCKTDNKFREYSICGIPGIFSKIPPYEDVVEHGVTGWVVENDIEAWIEALDRLIGDRDFRSQIAQAAKSHAEQAYSLPKVANRWLALMQELVQEGTGSR